MSRVDLPDPEGPSTLTDCRRDRERDAAQDFDGAGGAARVALWTPWSSIIGGGAELRNGAASDGEDGDEGMAEQIVQDRGAFSSSAWRSG